MSTDDSDKTVFSPGLGRRPTGGAQQPPMPGVSRPQPSPAPAAPRPTAAQPAAARGPVDASFFQAMTGLNPLVNAAAVLIGLMEKTRGSMSHPDIAGLHKRIISEIKTFETAMRDLNVAREIALSARYVICAVLDETVLSTPWGSESAWAQRSLLSVFHNESSGGEKFYLIMERMCQAPAQNIDMIELQYICLSLGFEGKYRINPNGRDFVERHRDELFNIIRRHRHEYERELCDHWQGLGKTGRSLAEFMPMWVLAVCVGAVLFMGFSGFRWWMHDSATPVAEELISLTEASQQRLAEKRAEHTNE